MINVNINNGFAKLDTFGFYTDEIGEDLIIDYGDGTTEFLNGRTTGFTHIYEDFGVYTASIRSCNFETPLAGNCINIFVEPYVKEEIVFVDPPLSSFASFNSDLYELTLSSSYPPPLKVKLTLEGSQLPHISSHNEDLLIKFKPSYRFLDINDEILEDDTLVIEDTSKIFVNGLECGYQGSGYFSFEYDGSDNLIVGAELINDEAGSGIPLDFDICPPSSTYIVYGSGANGIIMIDTDII